MGEVFFLTAILGPDMTLTAGRELTKTSWVACVWGTQTGKAGIGDQSIGPVTCSLPTVTSSTLGGSEEEITIHLTSRSCMCMRLQRHWGLCSKVHRSTWPAAPHLSVHRKQASQAGLTLTLALFSLHQQFIVWMHSFLLKITWGEDFKPNEKKKSSDGLNVFRVSKTYTFEKSFFSLKKWIKDENLEISQKTVFYFKS